MFAGPAGLSSFNPTTRRLIQDRDHILDLARHLADDVLFPTVNEVDVAALVPRSLLDRLADTGLGSEGSRSLLEGQNGERLSREAGFLLVFGSRPAIKASLTKRLQSALE